MDEGPFQAKKKELHPTSEDTRELNGDLQINEAQVRAQPATEKRSVLAGLDQEFA